MRNCQQHKQTFHDQDLPDFGLGIGGLSQVWHPKFLNPPQPLAKAECHTLTQRVKMAWGISIYFRALGCPLMFPDRLLDNDCVDSYFPFPYLCKHYTQKKAENSVNTSTTFCTSADHTPSPYRVRLRMDEDLADRARIE